jgi:hypothetical protein
MTAPMPEWPAGPPATTDAASLAGVDIPAGVGAIVSDVPGSFARAVWHDRHPALVALVRSAQPYGQEQADHLDELLEEIAGGPIAALPADAHDRQTWAAWGERFFGAGWLEVPFLWAESYFYRRLLGAVGFFTPGPWFWVDPFRPMKDAELPSLASLAVADDLRTLLLAATWGNLADLGFRLGESAAGEPAAGDALIVDDSAAVLAALGDGGARTALVADNGGQEMAADLLLADYLLTAGRAARVDLHVKPYPYYVSDATAGDVGACLRALGSSGGPAGEAAQRLLAAAAAARFTVRTHWFWCSPLSFHQMPADLAGALARSSLTIFKGDLNYRRLVGDFTWPATTRFEDAVTYMPGRIVALRVLKSDVVVGLDPTTERSLDGTGRPWRTSGSHALIQARL